MQVPVPCFGYAILAYAMNFVQDFSRANFYTDRVHAGLFRQILADVAAGWRILVLVFPEEHYSAFCIYLYSKLTFHNFLQYRILS